MKKFPKLFFMRTEEERMEDEIRAERERWPEEAPLIIGEPLLPCPFCGSMPILVRTPPHEMNRYETFHYFCPRDYTAPHIHNVRAGSYSFYSNVLAVSSAKWNRWCREAEKIRDDGKTAAEVRAEYLRTKYVPKIKKEKLALDEVGLYMYLQPFFQQLQCWNKLTNPHGYIAISPKHKPYLMAPLLLPSKEEDYAVHFFTNKYLKQFDRYADDQMGNHYDWELALDILFYPIKEALEKKGLRI